MPRYSAVLEVEFDLPLGLDPQERAHRIANGLCDTWHNMTGHVSPHTVRLAEEPACVACATGKGDCVCPIEDAWCGSFPMGEDD